MLAAEQVCWVPIDAIIGGAEAEGGATVLLRAEEGGRYTLLSGGARLDELRRAGRSCVDAVVYPKRDVNAEISALLTGLAAGKLSPFEEAERYQALLADGGVTRAELAARTGRSAAAIQKKLRLLELEDECRALLENERLCERYAASLLRVPSRQHRLRAARQIVGLTVREADALIDETLARLPIPVPKERRMRPAMRDHRLYLNAIRGIVDQMREAGLEAEYRQNVGATLVEIQLTIPRFGGR